MSEKQFEIAFSGEIVEGADLQSVKQKIGKIFNADEARLAKMFSGQRVLIKRQADEVTMIKYRGAFQKSGAVCEVVELSSTAESPATPQPDSVPPSSGETVVPQSGNSGYVSKYPESDDIPQALLTEPLGVNGDSIQQLDADLAPVGSPVQHQINEVEEPVIDISGMDVAPVGSDLSPKETEATPPPPDTTGLSMLD